MIHFLLSAVLMTLLPVLDGNSSQSYQKDGSGIAETYVTSADRSHLFEKTIVSSVDISQSYNIINIDTQTQYQTIDGFGAAITGASCYNLLKMDKPTRTEFLKEFFDCNEGLGVSLVRVSIGASDFSVDDEFTWCDEAGIEHFAVHKEDQDYLFPILKEIFAINPKVKIIASPWSAPRWMKETYSWTSSGLSRDYYDVYALYFVKWIQRMEQEGFPIYAMTIQNEPLNKGNSMSMYMTWQEQLDFIKNYLGPAFEHAGIQTKILAFDHNYNYDGIEDQQNYPLNILADAEAAKYIAGTAWHNYNGSVEELDKIGKQAPDKEIFFTEASIGTWNYIFEKSLIQDFKSIFVQTLSYGNKGVTLWNLALDENRSPYRKGGCSTCFGVVEINSQTNTVTDRKSHYYNIAHASKVIYQGAVRISSTGYSAEGLYYEAFLNPDGSIGIIAVNETDTDQEVMLTKDGISAIPFLIPAQSIASALIPIN